MNTLTQAFNFGQKAVRTTIMQGEAWFALADVAAVLDMKQPQNFLKSKWCDKEGVLNSYTLTAGGQQELVFINKPNVYAMVLRSTKDEAIAFQRWITHEVIPQIEQHGAYIAVGADQGSLFAGAMALVAQVGKLENRLERIESAIADAKNEVAELPSPYGEFPELTQTKFIDRLIRLYCTLSGCRLNAIYPKVYEQIEFRYSIRLSVRAKRAGYKSTLKYAIDHGHGQKMYTVIFHMLQKAVEDRAA